MGPCVKQGLLSLTAKSWLRCSCISQHQICNISENQSCISCEYAFSDLLQIASKFGHQIMSLALLGSKFGHHVVSLVLPNCLGMSYWHYQLVLGWYLHQPESHQLSLKSVSDSVTSGPNYRTPGLPGSDKNKPVWRIGHTALPDFSLNLSIRQLLSDV